MTNQEAIENIKKSIKAYEDNIRTIETVNNINKDWDGVSAHGQPISTENKIYKGTMKNLEACRIALSALEKQIPKKPNFMDSEIFECPSCGWKRSIGSICFCPTCGQAIDWSVDE